MIWSRRTAAYSYSIIRAASFICFSRRAISRSFSTFVILRAISDKADNSAEMDYPSFEKMAAHRCAEVTRNLALHLKESQEA